MNRATIKSVSPLSKSFRSRHFFRHPILCIQAMALLLLTTRRGVVHGFVRHTPGWKMATTGRMFVHLPSSSSSSAPPRKASVTGDIYTVDDGDTKHAPHVTLFTKEGCTLCDKVKDVLEQVRSTVPHSLSQYDITDSSETFAKYKYDIPVLHIGNEYWTKHRLTVDEAVHDLREATNHGGRLAFARPGEPNAAAMAHFRGDGE